MNKILINAFIVLVLTACGGEESTSGTGDTESAGETATPAVK